MSEEDRLIWWSGRAATFSTTNQESTDTAKALTFLTKLIFKQKLIRAIACLEPLLEI